MAKITGHQAIEYAEANGLTLNKHTDPTEEAREGLSVQEAKEIAAEDPSLIWVEEAAQEPLVVNFYGAESSRYGRAGKHPHEFCSEGEEFTAGAYGAVQARANELAEAWGISVYATERGDDRERIAEAAAPATADEN